MATIAWILLGALLALVLNGNGGTWYAHVVLVALLIVTYFEGSSY